MIRFTLAQCSLGVLLVAVSEQGICAIALGDGPDALVGALLQRFPGAERAQDDARVDELAARVVDLTEHPGRPSDLPLDIRGTAFQRRVWRALCEIPVGHTASYAQIASRIDAPKSARAVAGACAANMLAVVIPCHRIVRSDASLSGYRWGVARKRALLERETEQSGQR
ncbi:methylated-DNA--[protein]-cysteine S-methyltransferase [Niveibacterium terrae]|uniref:methylated-DNA--[protein]-cysteine S-methyltransferase n=1 Tax=Niveibacterium terrae TaxID=3373598 RepID=UPI003A8D6BB3